MRKLLGPAFVVLIAHAALATAGPGIGIAIDTNSMTGTGSSGDKLGLRRNCSATQVLVWNGSAWGCGSGVGGAVSGTTNTLSKFTSSSAVGDATGLTQTTSGTLIIAGTPGTASLTLSSTTANGINGTRTATAGTATDIAPVYVTSTGTFNTTAGEIYEYGVRARVDGTRSSGANVLNNWGTYGLALGGQKNIGAIGWVAASAGGTDDAGVLGLSDSTAAVAYGVRGNARGAATTNYGVFGTASGGTTNYAGYFDGRTYVNAAPNVAGLTVLSNQTGQTTSTALGAIDGSAATWNVTGAAKVATGLDINMRTSCVSGCSPNGMTAVGLNVKADASGYGSNARTAIYATTTSGSAPPTSGNYALYTDQGDVLLNGPVTTNNGITTTSLGSSGGITADGGLRVFDVAGAGLTSSSNTVNAVATTGGGLTVNADDIQMTYCAANQIPKMNAGGTAWTCAAASSGITNSASANYYAKSDGTNVVNGTMKDDGTNVTFNTTAGGSTAKVTIVSASGNITSDGALTINNSAGASGDFTVKKQTSGNAFTVASSSGNTTVAGTLAVTSSATALHFLGSGSPSLSSCGTSPSLTSGSNDSHGKITTGSAIGGTCTLTFGTTYGSAPFCILGPDSTNFVGRITSISATAFTFAANGSETYHYVCGR